MNELQNTHISVVVDAGALTATQYPADGNPALVYLAGLGAGSRRTMAQALDRIAEIATGGTVDAQGLPWHALRFQHTGAIRAALLEEYSPATTNKMLSALRGALKAAWRLGLMTAEEYTRAVDLDPVGVARPDQAAGRALTPGELMGLLGVCQSDTTAAGARDAAILGLLYACGLRRSEVVKLDVSDYDPATCVLTVRASKRGKTRVVPIENGAKAALLDWLHIRGDATGFLEYPHSKGRDATPLFVRILKSGEPRPGHRLTAQGVYDILNRRAEEAGVDSFTPHDLRRTFAGDLLDAGVDLATVQKMMGHSNPATTASYDRRGERAKRAAASKLHIPYKRRYTDKE